MKKILSSVLILLYSLTLASCERDKQKEDVFYNVNFYEENILLNATKYKEDSLIDLGDVKNPNNYEINYLVNKLDDSIWDLNNQVKSDLDLEVKFIDPEILYTLKILNEGVHYDEIEVLKDSLITKEMLPNEKGYIISKIINVKTNEEVFIGSKITMDMEINVLFVLDYENTNYQVSIYEEDTLIKEFKVKHNSLIDIKSIPLKDGYFINKIIDLDTKFEFDFNKEVTSNLKLSVIYERDYSKVFYNVVISDDFGVETRLEIKHNERISMLDIPSKEGYLFDKLIDLSTSLDYDFNNLITSNLNLKVIYKLDYTKVFYNVSIKDNEGLEKKINIKHNDFIALKDIPLKEGYIFLHLIDLDTKEIYDLNEPVRSNLNLEAVYERDYSNVFYDVVIKSEDQILKSFKVKHKEKISLNDIPTKDGYVIDSVIDLNTNKLYNFNNVITKELNLNVIYKEITFNVTFKVANSIYDKYEVKLNDTLEGKIILPPVHYRGEFIDWYHVGTNNRFNKFDQIKRNITLEARYDRSNLEANQDMNIFYLNDTHGGILRENNQLGLSNIANFINKSEFDNSIFITGGDMFQGQLISNDNRGQVMIESFNQMGLDAFVIGNHEFDWGLDVILDYFNPNTSGIKANFPLLGANIIDKRTGERPEYIDSHTIIERFGVRVGIIGVIGDGLESSILTPRVENYKFTNSLQSVKETHALIKDDVDLILVAAHSSSMPFTKEVALLDKVNGVFLAHSHRLFDGLVQNSNQKYIPYLQSGSSGQFLGQMRLFYQLNELELVYERGIAINSSSVSLFQEEDPHVKEIIDRYYDSLKNIYDDVILIASRDIDVDDLANYISRLMMEVSGGIAGFQNSGGTRGSFYQGQEITAAEIFKIFPFDNAVISSDIKGRSLKRMLNDDYFFRNFKGDINKIFEEEYYTIGTNDYIFYSSINRNLFYDARNTKIVGDMYETLYQVMLNYRSAGYEEFDTNLPILF